MFNTLTNRYQSDTQGVMLLVDIEAASVQERKGEIFEIAVTGINTCFSLVLKVQPELPLGKSSVFTNESSCYEYLRKQHGAEYFHNLSDSGVDAPQAAAEFYNQLMQLKHQEGREIVLFCRGMDYDPAILQHWLKVHGFPCPWHYRNVRDLRTIYATVPGFTPKSGNHTALGDVLAEVENIDKVCFMSDHLFTYFKVRDDE